MFSGCIAVWGVQRSDVRGNRNQGHVGDKCVAHGLQGFDLLIGLNGQLLQLLPMGEPRRVACSGSIGQRSGAVLSIVETALRSRLMTSDLAWFNWRPNSAASSVTL